jgi:transcriptional regulator with XRE-family HTH domain
MGNNRVGAMVREWRLRRRRSQLDLALEVGVSTRHLSFVETGRSRPSPELVLAIGHYLEVPLRDRNAMLLAAGYAPRYSHTPLDATSMQRIHASLQRMLDAHDPYPGVVIDHRWDVVLANRAATAMLEGVASAALEPSLNVFRLCLHPDGLAARTTNFDEWAGYLIHQLARIRVHRGDEQVEALAREVATYPNLPEAGSAAPMAHVGELPLLVSFRLRTSAGEELSLFTTLTTFGTPRDITLDELAVELFFPADDRTDMLLRSSADATSQPGSTR